MTNLIEIEGNFSGTTVTVADGSVVTGYTALREGTSLGAAVENPMYSRTIDSLGIRVTGSTIESRESQIEIIAQSTTESGLQALIDNAAKLCDEISRRGGGKLRYRTKAGSYVTTYKIAFATVSGLGDVSDYDSFFRQRMTIALVIDPYGLADPYDVFDDFSYNTFGTAGRYNRGGADWTAYQGALTNAAVTGGVLDASANLSTLNLFAHTGTPHTYGDVQIQLKHVTGSSVVSYIGGVSPKIIGTDSQNYIRVYVTASTLVIAKVVAGTPTTLSSVAITAIAASTTYWIVARIENNTVYAEHWLTEPTPMGTPTTSTSATFTTAEAAQFGSAIRGRCGIIWTPIQTAAYIDDVKIRACTYRSWSFPDVVPLNASWGGTVDAQVGIYYTSSGGTAPVWMLYSWWPTPPVHNFVINGGAEIVGTTASVAYQWSAAALSGVIGAGTSILRDTTSTKIRTGGAAFEVIVPATTDTGAYTGIARRFRKGVTYTAQAYLKALSGTTQVRIKLGKSGDIATSTAAALSTTWTLHTVTWTPTADTDFAYFAVGVNAATATTFQMDDVMVFQGTTAPTFEPGGYGPGIMSAVSYDQAKASISTDGSYWTVAADATYRSGFRVRGSGAMGATANLEFFIRPDLFTPDDFMGNEVDIAVYSRCEVASTQTSVACAISVAPEGGTGFGARKYSSFASTGKALALPSSSAFRGYYLGTVTCIVDRTNPVRWKLRLSFTNSGGATGNFGVDHIVLAPAQSIASSRTGIPDSILSDFISSTTETTKLVNGDLSAKTFQPGSTVSKNGFPDDGLLGARMSLPLAGAELLVWPADCLIDRTDSSATSMALSHTGTVQVAVQPQHHVLRQA